MSGDFIFLGFTVAFPMSTMMEIEMYDRARTASGERT